MSLQECDCQSLRKRVDALEAQNRRSMKVGLMVLIVAVCAVFMAQAAPKSVTPNRVVEAEDFVLRDSGGHIRARLGMWAGQQPFLVLFDSAESPRVLIGGTSPEVSIVDSPTRITRASMWIGAMGPNLGLFDREGRVRDVLSRVDSTDAASFSFYDDKAVKRSGIGFDKNGPIISLQDSRGNAIWSAPVPTGGGTSASQTKPRVVIESWESEEASGIFAARPPRQNAQALDEMPVFIQRCPQAAAVVEKHEGDYVLRYDHHYSQGSYSYGYTLFDSSGGSLGTGSSLALWAAADAACKGILSDWASRAH